MNQITTQQLDDLCKTLAKLMLNTYIEFDVFNHKLQNSLVKLAYLHYPTVTRVAIKTGLDRRVVADAINGKRPRLTSNVLKKLIKEIQYQSKQGNSRFNKVGRSNSMTTMIHSVANGATSSNAVVMELIQRGYLKDLGNRVEYQDLSKIDNNRIIQIFNEFILKFDELVEQIIAK